MRFSNEMPATLHISNILQPKLKLKFFVVVFFEFFFFVLWPNISMIWNKKKHEILSDNTMRKKSGLYWMLKGNTDIKMHIIARPFVAINMLHILSHYISCTRLPTQSQQQCQKSNSVAGFKSVANYEGCAFLWIFF